MPLATFQTSFGKSAIESDAGIIRGVRVMNTGHVARFGAIKEDGTKIQKQITISDAHISALMSHAGNRSIPVHWTHAAANEKADGLATKAGALKSFRKDESGNLLADLHLVPGEIRDLALWHADNDPENMMLSAVYTFLPDDENCIPQDFQAADLVEKGAGVTALFSESTNTTMPEDTSSTAASGDLVSQLVAACQDPHALAAFKALIKSVESSTDKVEEQSEGESANDDAGAIAAMALSAGVTDVDKMPEDAKLRPLLACFAQCERARARKQAEMTATFEKAKADILLAAKAEVVAELGSIKTSVKDDTKKADMALFGFDKVKHGIRAQLNKN